MSHSAIYYLWFLQLIIKVTFRAVVLWFVLIPILHWDKFCKNDKILKCKVWYIYFIYLLQESYICFIFSFLLIVLFFIRLYSSYLTFYVPKTINVFFFSLNVSRIFQISISCYIQQKVKNECNFISLVSIWSILLPSLIDLSKH